MRRDVAMDLKSSSTKLRGQYIKLMNELLFSLVQDQTIGMEHVSEEPVTSFDK